MFGHGLMDDILIKDNCICMRKLHSPRYSFREMTLGAAKYLYMFCREPTIISQASPSKCAMSLNPSLNSIKC